MLSTLKNFSTIEANEACDCRYNTLINYPTKSTIIFLRALTIVKFALILLSVTSITILYFSELKLRLKQKLNRYKRPFNYLLKIDYSYFILGLF